MSDIAFKVPTISAEDFIATLEEGEPTLTYFSSDPPNRNAEIMFITIAATLASQSPVSRFSALLPDQSRRLAEIAQSSRFAELDHPFIFSTLAADEGPLIVEIDEDTNISNLASTIFNELFQGITQPNDSGEEVEQEQEQEEGAMEDGEEEEEEEAT